MRPGLFLASLVGLYCGWQLFPDGPLAFYVMTGIWVAGVSVALGAAFGGAWWPAAGLGFTLGLLHAGCGAAYVADGRSFVCDSGTGLPVTPLVLAVAAGVMTYYWRRREPA